MLRKVIQIAGKTQVVSLPSAWLRKFGVKKGDDLLVEEKDSFLVITPTKEIKKELLQLNVSGSLKAIKRVLGGAYKSGFDEVEVAFETEQERKEIERTLETSIKTFAVISCTNNRIVIKNVSRLEVSEFDLLLRRLFLLLLSNAKELARGINTNDNPLLNEVIQNDIEINNNADYCRRILNKEGHAVYTKTPAAYVLVEQLEKIGDTLRDIAKESIKQNPKEKEVHENLIELEAVLREFYEMYYQFSMQKLSAWFERMEILRQKIGKTKNTQSTRSYLVASAAEELFSLNGALIICAIG